MKEDKSIIKGANTDYEKIVPGGHPAENFKTPEGFIKWYDQKTWGTKKGSLGLEKETVGTIMNFKEFAKSSRTLQGK